jgi:hypothetical protein
MPDGWLSWFIAGSAHVDRPDPGILRGTVLQVAFNGGLVQIFEHDHAGREETAE